MSTGHVSSLPKLFRDKEDFRLFHGNHKQAYFLAALIYVELLASLAVAQQAIAGESIPLRLPCAALAFMAIGWGQFALSNGLHEALHRNFGNRRSDRWAALLLAYPLGLTMSYRRVHDLHHRYVGSDRDPDLPKYWRFPRTKGRLALRILASGSGVPALTQFLHLTFGKVARGNLIPGAPGARPLHELPRLAAVQAVILGAVWVTLGNPILYLVFWVLPLMTVAKFLTTLRVLCEHGSPDQEFVYRSLAGRSWQSWVLGSFDFNYHAEHHLYPSVPYAHLERLHQRHQDHRLAHPDYRPFDGRYERYEGSYLDLLVFWFRTLPWRDGRSPEQKWSPSTR